MRFPTNEDFGKEVIAFWGPIPGNHGERARGKLLSYLNEPSVQLELEDGTTVRWAVSLCEFAETLEVEEK